MVLWYCCQIINKDGNPLLPGFLPGIFSGARAKSIVMKIPFVVLIFLLFSDQISGGGGQTASNSKFITET